jgi:hypothetical protein
MCGEKFMVYRSPTFTGIKAMREVAVERNIIEVRAARK